MKRSEMIDLIYNHIDGYMNPSSSYNVAVKLLEKIEKAGMVPPIIKDKSFRIEEDGQMTYAVHEWESEGLLDKIKKYCGGGCHE